ncbi:B12-binding domain-containing radical SAM protein [Marinicella gelatinilytica]|uniref:B12-binding domain-containing radical SAM protein n=1 Tax=Marinicella gelatinilytica TaxID=2996017 RepID=UPI002260C477|nr:radical SAM protein [Marinicella gelatinilytica]MCX7544119.1 radical SAM protein [Marinicella gelatinilytica]
MSLQFNNRFQLIFRDNRLIASQIDGQGSAMYLHTLDLIVFELLKENAFNLNGFQSIAHDKWVQRLAKGINESQIQSRLQQLKSGNILIDQCRTISVDNTMALNQTNISSFNLPAKLTTSKHLSFFRNESDWCFWSSPLNQYITCNYQQLIILSQFLETQNIQRLKEKCSEKFNQKLITDTLTRFFETGVLIDVSGLPEKKDCSCTDTEQLQQIDQSKWWQNIEPDDNRLPIYFVPHMKNHYPLALGVLFSSIKNFNDGELLNKYQLVPINFLEPKDLFNGPYKKFGTGIWLFSNYMWSLDVNMVICNAIKKHNPSNITIHGGPSTPEYPQASQDFMSKNLSVDISVHGEGEISINEILSNIKSDANGQPQIQAGLELVHGITFRNKNDNSTLHRTPKRSRTATPDSVPSPYLTGCFDGYGVDVEAAIIESNRGCPFGCTFCDWGSATNQKVRKFDLQRVKDEIDWIASNQIRVLWIADANYGLYDRDIELAQYIVETKKRTGFPEEVVVNYTKNSTWRLVEIIKVFNAGGIISQGIISIQTTDEKTLEVINRKNIKTEKYDELTKVFYDLRLPLSTDLMMGLPGITIAGFNKDLQKYIDMDVSIKAYPTQLLPNSPMADPEYLEKYQIKTDENDFLIASFSYTEEDLKWMKAMYHMYTVADGYGLLRYVIRYLQWEHNIQAVDFMGDLLKFVNHNPSKYQQITWAVRFFITDKSMPGGWYRFYQQIGQYINEHYDIVLDSGLKTVLTVSQYCMPDDTLDYPVTIKLAHDFTAYFSARRQHSETKCPPLTAYPAANFQVSDPNNMVSIDMDYLQYDSHQYFWELHSPVSRPKSSSEFVYEKETAEA